MASFITIIAGLFLANVQGLLGSFFSFFGGMIYEGSHGLLVSSLGFLQDLDMAVQWQALPRLLSHKKLSKIDNGSYSRHFCL